MQNYVTHPKPTELETLDVGPNDADAVGLGSHFEKHWSRSTCAVNRGEITAKGAKICSEG